MKILVPLDGTAASEAVLPWAGAFLARTGTEVDLLHVSPVRADEDAAPDRPGASWAPHECSQYLEEVRGRMASWGERVRASVETGDPALMILRAARASGADLILLRTRSLQGVSRLLLGSTAAEVLQDSPVPLLALGPAFRPPDAVPAPKHVLVPLDGSGWSAQILKDAARLARLFGARATLFHAGHAVPGLQGLADGLSREGVPCSVAEAPGDPVGAILGRAGASGVGLVAMATHGRSGLLKVVLGSVAERVLRECPVPVLLRRPA